MVNPPTMLRHKFRYRDYDIAADFSNILSEIYIEDFNDVELIYEGAYTPDVIEFFSILNTAIDEYEAERKAIIAVQRNDLDADRDDIPF